MSSEESPANAGPPKSEETPAAAAEVVASSTDEAAPAAAAESTPASSPPPSEDTPAAAASPPPATTTTTTEEAPAATQEPASPATTTDASTAEAEGSADADVGEEPTSPSVAAAAAIEPIVTPRVVIVTGASSGIGLHVARVLCAKGHDVILGCRNQQKTERALEKIRKDNPDAKATFMQLDLADLESIRKFASNFRASGKQLSVLINNAGVTLGMNTKDTRREYTADNFELMMGTNHLGHFLLTNLLLDDLKKTASEGGDARVVVITSAIHDPQTLKKRTVHPLDLDDLFLSKDGAYSGLQAYKNSKLANVMFVYELARQLGGSGVKANAIDPGTVTSTDLLRHSSGPQKLFQRIVLNSLLRLKKQARTAAQAAIDIYNVAIADEFKDVSGKYIQHGQEAKSSEESLDESAQKRLWELSGRYTRLDGFEPLIAPPPPTPAAPTTGVDVVNGTANKDTEPKNSAEPDAAAKTEENDAAADKGDDKDRGKADGEISRGTAEGDDATTEKIENQANEAKPDVTAGNNDAAVAQDAKTTGVEETKSPAPEANGEQGDRVEETAAKKEDAGKIVNGVDAAAEESKTES